MLWEDSQGGVREGVKGRAEARTAVTHVADLPGGDGKAPNPGDGGQNRVKRGTLLGL